MIGGGDLICTQIDGFGGTSQGRVPKIANRGIYKVSEEALVNLPTQTPLGNIDIRALIPIALLPAPYGDFSGELRVLVIGFIHKREA